MSKLAEAVRRGREPGFQIRLSTSAKTEAVWVNAIRKARRGRWRYAAESVAVGPGAATLDTAVEHVVAKLKEKVALVDLTY